MAPRQGAGHRLSGCVQGIHGEARRGCRDGDTLIHRPDRGSAQTPRLLRHARMQGVRPWHGQLLRRRLHRGGGEPRVREGDGRQDTGLRRDINVQKRAATPAGDNGLGERLGTAISHKRSAQQLHPHVPQARTGHRVRRHHGGELLGCRTPLLRPSRPRGETHEDHTLQS